jgi:hypothetical protein
MSLPGEAASPPYRLRVTGTSSSAALSSETVTDTITVSLVAGEEYKIEHTSIWGGSSAGISAVVRVREDSIVGTQLNGVDVFIGATGRSFGSYIRAFFTAVASGSKTFVVTGASTSGTVTRAASSTNPSHLTVSKEV